jgi:hypothetical protein
MKKLFSVYIIVILQAYLAGYCYLEKEYTAAGVLVLCTVATFLVAKMIRGAMK